MDFIEGLENRVMELEMERTMLRNEIYRLNILVKDLERQIFNTDSD